MTQSLLIQRAIDICGGSQEKLAKQIGYSQATVHFWLNEKFKPDHNACRNIEAATLGEISKEMLRPDIYPPPTAGAPS